MLSASQLAARPPVREVAQVRNTVVDELRLMSLIRLAGRPRDGLSRKVALRRIEALNAAWLKCGRSPGNVSPNL